MTSAGYRRYKYIATGRKFYKAALRRGMAERASRRALKTATAAEQYSALVANRWNRLQAAMRRSQASAQKQPAAAAKPPSQAVKAARSSAARLVKKAE